MTQEHVPAEPVRPALAAIVVGVCGPIVFVTVPFFLALVKADRGFSGSQISLFSAADMLGMFVASLYTATWIRDAAWRPRAVAACLLLAASTGLSMLAQSFIAFALTRVAAGFGAGTLMAIGLAAMGGRRRSDSWFGWFGAAQASLGGVAAWFIPRFVAPYGLNGYLTMLILVYLLAIPFALRVPARAGESHRKVAAPGQRLVLPLAAGSLAAAFAFSLGIFAIWSHLQIVGAARGLSSIAMGNAISAAYLLGIVASAVAALVAGRLHRFWFFLTIVVCQVAGLILLAGPFTATSFTVATLLLGWAWYFSVAFQLGITVDVDPSRRLVVLFIAAVKSSYVASGILLSLLLAGREDLAPVIWVAAAGSLMSFLIYSLLSFRTSFRAPADVSAGTPATFKASQADSTGV